MTSSRTALLLALAATASCTMPPASGPAGETPDDPVYDDGTSVDRASDRTLRFYYGPMKLMLGETILNSIAAATGHDFGDWDFTTPDPATTAFFEAGNGDGAYYRHCRLLGGCMEHRIPLGRTSFVGTAYVLQLEQAVGQACSDQEAFGMFPGGAAPPESASVDALIGHQYVTAYAAPPTDEELVLSRAYFESHLADPETSDVSPLESAGRGHCRALLSTNRFLFY